MLTLENKEEGTPPDAALVQAHVERFHLLHVVVGWELTNIVAKSCMEHAARGSQ